MKKAYQVLDFSLTTSLLPGKDNNYSGPKTIVEICEKISEESKQLGLDVPYDNVYAIIRHYFYQMISHMKKGDFMRLEEMGDFAMSPAERRKRNKIEDKIYIKRRNRQRFLWAKKYHKIKLRNEWKEFNRVREEKGLRPWSYRDWVQVHKKYLPTKIKSDDKYKITK